jgi:serine/threonine protein kinase
VPQDTIFQLGDRIGQDGKYEIIKILGEGGMGAVFKAFDHFLEREVAIKTILLHQDPATTKALRERFLREARSVARVSNHPNIVQIYEVGADAERPFIAMEFIDGKDVSKLKPRLTVEQVLFICERVASALDFIHSKGIFHRDVKPGNIMVGNQWEVKLMDFGIAKDTKRTSMTQYAVRLGSPLYMAPETLAEEPIASAQSDQYALAVILYESLTMRYPFDAADFAGLFVQICGSPPKSSRSFSPWMPAAAEAVLNRGLAKSAKERFRSCGELVSEFRRALGDPGQLQAAVDARRSEAALQFQQIHTNLTQLRAFTDKYQDWPEREQALERIQQLEDEDRKRDSRERIALQALEVAKDRKNVSALHKFLEKFPDSQYAGEARNQIALIEQELKRAEEDKDRRQRELRAYEAVRTSTDLDKLQNFLYDYPDSDFAPEIASQIARLRSDLDRRKKEREQREGKAREELRYVIPLRDLSALHEWLNRYSDLTELAAQARQQVKLIEIEVRAKEDQARLQRELDAARIRKAFEDATVALDSATLQKLIDAYPDAPEVPGARDAMGKIAQVERQRREKKARQAFDLASAFRDVELLRSFPQQFPDSELAPKAAQLLAEIEREEREKHERETRLEAARQAFEFAETFRDREMLTAFLRDYPSAPQAASAKQLLSELDEEDRRKKAQAEAQAETEKRLAQAGSSFQQARQSRDPARLHGFLTAFPDSPFITEARTLLREIEEWTRKGDSLFNTASNTRSVTSLQQFVRDYGGHPKAAEAAQLIPKLQREEAEKLEARRQAEEAAKRRAEEAAKQQAEEAARRQAAEEAKRRAEEAERQRVQEEKRRAVEAEQAAENTAWARLHNASEPSEIEAFLARFPNGARKAEAQTRLASLRKARQEILNSEDPSVLRHFIASNPSSPDRFAAQTQLGHVENTVWSQVDRRDKTQIQSFLQTFAESPHARAASSELAKIEQEERAFAGLSGNDPNQLAAFLKNYPASSRTTEVRRRLTDAAARTVVEAPPPARIPPPDPVRAGNTMVELRIPNGKDPRLLPVPARPPEKPPTPRVAPPPPQQSKKWIGAAAGLAGIVAVALGLWFANRPGPPKPTPDPVVNPPVHDPTLPPSQPKDTGDEAAWTRAGLSNDPAATREYLAKYPAGIHASEASKRISSLIRASKSAYDTAVAGKDPNLLEAFDQTYPWSDQAKTAKALATDMRTKEDSRYRDVHAAPNGEKITAFVKDFPWSPRINELRGLGSAEDYWTGVAKSKNPKEFEDFRQRFPGNPHSQEAQTKAQQLRTTETSAWSQIAKSDKSADFEKFAVDFPWSEHRQQAEQQASAIRAEEAAWESISKTNPKDLELFRSQHPSGRFAKEALRVIGELNNHASREWEQVKAKNDPKAYDQFSKDYPFSEHAAEAKAKAEQLRKAEEARLKDEQDKKDRADREKAAKEGIDKPKPDLPGTTAKPQTALPDVTGKDGIVYKGIPGRAFRMAQTETTRAAFDRYLEATPPNKSRNTSKPDLPVVDVSFSDAEAYCAWVGGRLPTKQEWEYAAHGGKDSDFPNGDDITKDQARYGSQYMSPALSFPPNGYGLYHMVGNVAEFVQGRMVKGGFHMSGKEDLRIKKEYGIAKEGKSAYNGFRCVLP